MSTVCETTEAEASMTWRPPPPAAGTVSDLNRGAGVA